MNPYYYLFYLIYKFVKLTTKKELQDQVPKAALASLFFGLINYYAAVIIIINPFQYIHYSVQLLIIIFILPLIILYFLNRYFFLKNGKYEEIEQYYDRTNKLKKIHFILITALYMALSIGAMVGAGIFYSSNN